MNFKDIILSEIASQKRTNTDDFMRESKVVKIKETESRKMVVVGGGVNAHSFSFAR